MAPIKSSLSRSASKLLGVFRDRDTSLRGFLQSSRGDFAVRFDLLLVAGGGSGGGSVGGGGGGGGVLYAEGLALSTGTYKFTVGNGGAGVPKLVGGNIGGQTHFGTPDTNWLSAIGGGGGGAGNSGSGTAADDGGSGGGGLNYGGDDFDGGAANQPTTWNGPAGATSGSTITAYANPGASGPGSLGHGGGGAGATGSGKTGGDGQPFPVVTGSNFPSTPGYYAGGGAGNHNTSASGGEGGGGDIGTPAEAGGAGATNTGGGGAGGFSYAAGSGGAGGSGVAFLIVPNDAAPSISTPAPSVAAGDSSSRTVFKFTSTNTFTYS